MQKYLQEWLVIQNRRYLTFLEHRYILWQIVVHWIEHYIFKPWKLELHYFLCWSVFYYRGTTTKKHNFDLSHYIISIKLFKCIIFNSINLLDIILCNLMQTRHKCRLENDIYQFDSNYCQSQFWSSFQVNFNSKYYFFSIWFNNDFNLKRTFSRFHL